MLAVQDEGFDPSLAGLFASHPPAEIVPLLAAIAADVRPETLRIELPLMAQADLQRPAPPHRRPTLLIWGQHDARSPVNIAHQFHQAIPDSTLVVIDGAGHLSHLERPDQVNQAMRTFCRAHSSRSG